jgi:hypothetical protein
MSCYLLTSSVQSLYTSDGLFRSGFGNIHNSEKLGDISFKLTQTYTNESVMPALMRQSRSMKGTDYATSFTVLPPVAISKFTVRKDVL